MKKQLLTILAAGAVSSMFAQLPVSTTPQNKKVVLEEYTGIHCGYCPDGHKIATNIYNADPNNVILVNVHAGGFATPASGEPDYRTADGTSMNSTFGITGYPTGQVNRVAYSGTLTLSRSAWTNASNLIKTQSAYCNVALQGTVDAVTRVLTVQAQVYYTGNSPVGTNYLTVMLLENNVPGPQTDYGPTTYNPTNYNVDGSYRHNHFLRKTITSTFGNAITPTTAGSTHSTTLTYTIPAIYGAGTNTNTCMLGRLELVAFVSQTNGSGGNIINGAKGPLTLSNIPNSLDASPVSLTPSPMNCSGSIASTMFSFANYGSAPITNAVFSYNLNGGPPSTYTYTGTLNPLTLSPIVSLPAMAGTPLASNTINISVVSVNSGTDQNSINDIAVKTVTYGISNSLNMTMSFTQDRYGDEVSWGLLDDVSLTPVPGATISAGTYPVLGANGTQLHTHTFVVNPASCYRLVVGDTYGDGVNAGYGAGGYNLKSGVPSVISSNGMYGSGETKWTNTSVTSGIAAAGINVYNVSLYPNPAVSSSNLNVEMRQNENMNIVIVNSIGQVVYNEAVYLNAGTNTINLNTENWASGLYNINMTTQNGSATQKLTISK